MNNEAREPVEVTLASIIALREVTGETVRQVCKLSDTLSEAQKHLVAPNAISIAEAYFCKEAWFRAIYADEIPVGFVMLYIGSEGDELPEVDGIHLWRFMIAGPYQKLGFGRKALLLVIDHARSIGAKSIHLSFVDKESSPEGFYRTLGFQRDGKVYDDEIGMTLQL